MEWKDGRGEGIEEERATGCETRREGSETGGAPILETPSDADEQNGTRRSVQTVRQQRIILYAIVAVAIAVAIRAHSAHASYERFTCGHQHPHH